MGHGATPIQKERYQKYIRVPDPNERASASWSMPIESKFSHVARMNFETN